MKKEIKKIGSNMTTYNMSEFWGDRDVLVSYKTPVAVFFGGDVPTVLYTREGLASSQTTARHINKWSQAFGSNIKKVEVTASAISLLA